MIEIQTAFNIKIDSIGPKIDTAYENGTVFNPVAGTPYQELYLMPSYNDNPFIDNAGFLSYGIYQITLKYPKNQGTKAMLDRVKLYLDNFKSGSNLTKDGIVINIQGTPSIKNLGVVGDRFVYAISINYMAHYEMV